MRRYQTLLAGMLVLILLLPYVGVEAQTGDDEVRYGNRLFVDDFTTYVNGWERVQTAKYRLEYVDFAYQFDIRSPGVRAWSGPKYNFDLNHYAIEVTASIDPESAADSFSGLMLNYQDNENFYVFGIDSDGNYEVRLRLDGKWEEVVLVGGQVELADAYHLSVKHADGEFSISVNGETELLFSDYRLSGGAFGLYAQAGYGQVLVSFDDYLVRNWE